MNENKKKSAILISIGDELLIGQTVNTNTSWLAEQLTARGVDVLEMTTVPDEKDAILKVFKEATERAELVICTGGLGPTSDDLTAKLLGEFFGEKTEFNEEVFSWISEFKKTQKKPINELHRQQAILPLGFKYFRNSAGTAPAMSYQSNGTFFIALPGVPYEMKALMDEEVFPYLSEKITRKAIRTKTLLTAAVPESEIASTLKELEEKLPQGVSLAYLPSLASVKIRINSKAEDEDAAEKGLKTTEEKIRQLLGDSVYGEDEDTLEELIGQLLLDKGWTMATAESCTGGYIAHMITTVAGSSQYFNGSVIAYSNAVKVELLKVRKKTLEEYGAVSEHTVTEMLGGICKRLKADCAIAVSGIAGPGGGTKEKPVGMVCVAVGNANNQNVETLYLNHIRKLNIEKSAFLALNMFRLFLQRS